MKRAALLVLLVSGIASGQPAELTKEFQAGVDAFRLGKYDEARARLEKARSLDPRLPGPHRFLAAVAHAQQRWRDCIDSAYRALELNPRSSEAADTRKLHETCRVAAGRVPWNEELGDSAAIAITTNVSGATVKINGLTYGGTPLLPRPITAGPLDIEIEKVGWKPHKRTVTAIPGIVTDLEVELDVDPEAKNSEQLDVEPAKAITVGYLVLPADAGAITIDGKPVAFTGERLELEPGTHVVEISQPGKDPWRRRVRISAGQKTTVSPAFYDTGERAAKERTGFVFLGVSGAVLAGGFVAAVLSRQAGDEARDIVRIERSRDPTRPISETSVVAPLRTRADLEDARDRHERWALISNVVYAAGLVTAGVGAYFLYRGARERRDAPPPFAIAPVQGGAIVAKELSW